MVIYKRGGGFEFETTERQIQQVTGAGHEPGTPECESDALTRSRRTRYLPVMQYFQS